MLRNARADGKQLGRSRQIVNQNELVRLTAAGLSLRQISKTLGVAFGTVRTRSKLSYKPQRPNPPTPHGFKALMW